MTAPAPDASDDDAYRRAARRLFGGEHVDIEDDADVIPDKPRRIGGAFVTATVWVYETEIEPQDKESGYGQ